MTQEMWMGLARTLLGFAAGAVASKGYMDEATAQQAVGALMVLGTAAWSVTSKKKR